MQDAFLPTLAQANLQALAKKKYPGRGIVIGRSETSLDIVQAYWIMGRSPTSRNRIFQFRETNAPGLWTAVADPTKPSGDPQLTIYPAMMEEVWPGGGHYVVSNGSQTEIVLQQSYLEDGLLAQIMLEYQYEPDPSSTPRITAICTLGISPIAEMSIIKKSPFGDGCEWHHWQFEKLGSGFGHCITTYDGRDDVLAPFFGEPDLLPLIGDGDAIAQTLWQALDPDNRVALAVKVIPINGNPSRTTIINKYGYFPKS